MRSILYFILMVLTLSVGCSPSYYSYVKGKAPEHINAAKIIPIWIDDSFTPAQRVDILKSVDEWNLVFNNQIRLMASGYFHGADGAEDKYQEISKTHLGWIVVKANEKDPLVKDIIGPADLAFAVGLGGQILVVISDRIGTRNLKTILMHEMGHLLGANHVNTPSLMMPKYGEQTYNCIDKITSAQVASFQNLNFETFNYCKTPFFE